MTFNINQLNKLNKINKNPNFNLTTNSKLKINNTFDYNDKMMQYEEIDYNITPTNYSQDLTITEHVVNTTGNGTKEINLQFPKKQLYDYDENGNVSLKETHPILKEKMELLQELCKQEGINIKITESVRTVERQNELYEKGRSTSGDIVTNAKGEDYNSFHQWGIAFDICINEIDNAYNIEKLKRVGEIGKSIGLEWGGDWTTFTDMPHFQLPGYEDGISKLKEQYENPAEFADTWYIEV